MKTLRNGIERRWHPELEFQYWVTNDGQRCGIHDAVGDCRGPPSAVRRAVEPSREIFDGADVIARGSRRVITTQFLQHDLV